MNSKHIGASNKYDILCLFRGLHGCVVEESRLLEKDATSLGSLRRLEGKQTLECKLITFLQNVESRQPICVALYAEYPSSQQYSIEIWVIGCIGLMIFNLCTVWR
jgi:hypothetical protein